MHENINVLTMGETMYSEQFVYFGGDQSVALNVIDDVPAEDIVSLFEKCVNSTLGTDYRDEAIERIKMHILLNEDANIGSCLNAIRKMSEISLFVSKVKTAFLPVSSSYV